VNESDDLEKKSTPEKPAENFRLSSRLRDKLGDAADGGDDDGEWNPEKRSPIGLIVTLVLIVVLVGGGGWFYQNHQTQLKLEAERVPAVAAREKAVVDSIAAAAIAFADSVSAAARADSIAAFNKLPRWKQRQIVAALEKAAAQDKKPAGGATASATGATSGGSSGASTAAPAAPAAPAEPQESGSFALDAGEFLFEAPATRAAEALKASTGLDAVVRPVGSGDNAVFHVYLGKFSGRSAAVSAANDLMGKGLVNQARVVNSPK
jgi:hypothetical protein